jgi:hypothetical protein
VYATCASGCGSLAGWAFLDLTSLAPGRDAVGTTRPFIVEPGGRVSFVTSDPGVYFACNGSCTALTNWSASVSLNGRPLHAGIDGAGVTHVLMERGTTTAGDELLVYARCAANCTAPASWEVSSLGFLHRAHAYAMSLVVTAGGRVFIAYNQGATSGSPSENRKLFVNSCAGAGCMDLNSWSSVTLGELDEGLDGAWLQASGEALVLASVAGFELRLRGCDGSCQAAGSWSAPVVADTSAAINQAWPPDTATSCQGTSESASWWPRTPRVGASPRGVVVVHNPSGIVKCPGNPNPFSTPNIGRVISTF